MTQIVLHHKNIPVAPLTLRMLKSFYSTNTNIFNVDTKDIYYRRITSKVTYRSSDPSDLLSERAIFVLKNSAIKKFNSEPFSLGFALYKASQFDLCNYLLAQVESGTNINDAIENFYYKNELTEEDYQRDAVKKLFYRFRKRLDELKNQENNKDFQQNNKTKNAPFVLYLQDAKTVHINKILTAVAAAFDVTTDDILSDSKKGRVTDARHSTIYILVQSGKTYRQVGSFLNRSFSNFSTIRKKIEYDIKIGNNTGLRVKNLLSSLFNDVV